MEAIAKTRHLKGSPRKARLVIDLIRGRNVSQALNILKFTDKRAAEPIEKTLRSAIANATYLAEQQNIAVDPDDLFIKTCFVDMGAHKNRRRMRPAPQGRAFREQRHYCHITILVSSDVPPAKDEDLSRKKGKKLLAKEAQNTEQKLKTPAKPKAEKKAAKVDEIKEENKTAAVKVPAEIKETKKAKVEKTVEAKTPIVQEQVAVETAKSEEPKVETPKSKVAATEEVSKIEVVPIEKAEVEKPKIVEPKVEKIVEAKGKTVKEPKADEAAEEKTAKSETSDLLEIESPKETKDSKAAKDDAKADAKISDAKNVQSQTPAERNETKKADDAQLDENDILELQ